VAVAAVRDNAPEISALLEAIFGVTTFKERRAIRRGALGERELLRCRTCPSYGLRACFRIPWTSLKGGSRWA